MKTPICRYQQNGTPQDGEVQKNINKREGILFFVAVRVVP
jgi:hypothetical protein